MRISEDDIVVTVDQPYPARKIVRQAVEILKAGGVISYPTDTTYGLGCDIFNKEAIERVYRLKRMTRHKPLSFICADLKEIARYAQVSNYAYQVMRRLLPGPYTFVMLATKTVPKMMLTKRKTVGIRVPKNDICLSLVSELGHPIISTSAQIEDEDILHSPLDIEKKFGHGLDLIIDDGTLVAEQSSMIDLTTDSPVILREGSGDVSMFR